MIEVAPAFYRPDLELGSRMDGEPVKVDVLDDDSIHWETETSAEVARQQDDFTAWEQEMTVEVTVDGDKSSLEITDENLELAILDSPWEPQTSWAESESNGSITEANYRQQCYWVIGQFGHMIDCVRPSITSASQAEEWLEMKKTIQAAKSESNPYELAGIRSQMIPVWADYVTRMNFDAQLFESVKNN